MTTTNRISQEGDDALVGPEHRHDGINGTCTNRHLVEPIDERTSPYLRGLSIEQIVSQHEHGEGMFKEGEIALDLMKRLRTFCNQSGFHTHGMATDATADRTFNSSPMAHHHHDLRCLIEAGANQVRPRLADVTLALTESRERGRANRKIIRRQTDEIAVLDRDLKGARAAKAAMADEHERVLRFMLSMPAVGPWDSVREQYDSWCVEQEDEAGAVDA